MPDIDEKHISAYTKAMQLAMQKALGLEGHKVRRIEITLEVLQPVKVTIYEYGTIDVVNDVVHVLELGDWHDA